MLSYLHERIRYWILQDWKPFMTKDIFFLTWGGKLYTEVDWIGIFAWFAFLHLWMLHFCFLVVYFRCLIFTEKTWPLDLLWKMRFQLFLTYEVDLVPVYSPLVWIRRNSFLKILISYLLWLWRLPCICGMLFILWTQSYIRSTLGYSNPADCSGNICN